MRMETEIVQASGINARNCNPLEIFLLARAIIHDEAIVRQWPRFAVGSRIPMGTTVLALQSLSESERAALRERVSATVIPSRNTPPGKVAQP